MSEPRLCDLVQRLGAFVRFGTSIPQRLNEVAIIMAGRKWTAQYEFYAHRRLVGTVGYYSLVSMTLNVARVPLPAGVMPPLK